MAVTCASMWNETVRSSAEGKKKRIQDGRKISLKKFDFSGSSNGLRPLEMACEIPSLNMINDIGHELYFQKINNMQTQGRNNKDWKAQLTHQESFDHNVSGSENLKPQNYGRNHDWESDVILFNEDMRMNFQGVSQAFLSSKKISNKLFR